MPTPTSRPSADVNKDHSIDPDGQTSDLWDELEETTHDLTRWVRSRARVFRPPNVIMIMSDDEKYSEIEDGFLRPTFKTLMRDAGTRFTQYKVVRSVCTPSRATYVTGQYNQNNDAWSVPGWNGVDKTNLIFRWIWAGTAKVKDMPLGYSSFWRDFTFTSIGVDDYTLFDPNGGEFTVFIDDFGNPPAEYHGSYTGINLLTSRLTGITCLTPTDSAYIAPGLRIIPTGSSVRRIVQTGMVGKINNDYGEAGSNTVEWPTPLGVDHWRVFNDAYTGQYGWQAREEDYTWDGNLDTGRYYGPDHGLPQNHYYITDYIADQAVKLIDKFTTRDPSDPRFDLPFYLQLCPTNPHSGSGRPPTDQSYRDPPISGDPTGRQTRIDSYNSWLAPFWDAPHGTNYPNIDLGSPEFTSGLIESERNRMRGLIACDDLLKTVIDKLSSMPHEEGGTYLDHTIIVYTSDNGWSNGENDDWQGKDSPYDASLKVPFVWRGPGIAAGVQNEARVCNVDWGATLASIFGVNPGLDVDGLDMKLAVTDPHVFDERPIYLTCGPQTSGRHISAGFNMVETGRWKYGRYVAHSTDSYPVPLLFDHDADPWEMTNLYSNPAYASVIAELDTLLLTMRACHGETCRLVDA